MEINILLTILLIIISLGGLLLQGCGVSLIKLDQMGVSPFTKCNLISGLHEWAVKLERRGSYLLNTVIFTNAQKATQTTLIQLQNHNFRG
ncbi:hypothetical protein [Falsiporphyromonas endometrii]|uniref:Uncharacterized protein n=1 Tax=Falsiporphyromonas endometrii TaxID=1387297 RepID=A0ABV9K576_9PORP